MTSAMAEYLHHRPTARKADFVDTESLLPVRISDVRINIVIVQDRAKARIIVNTLATRSVDIVMALQDGRASTCSTTGSSLINLVSC